MASALQLLTAKKYSLYVLFMMLAAYLLNQLDRYALAIVSKPMAQDIHFGEKSCMTNHSLSQSNTKLEKFCKNVTNEDRCGSSAYNTTVYDSCEWNYDGTGLEYQIVAGPIFIVIYTFAGIPLGISADQYSRTKLMGVCVILWSTMTLLTGFVTEYWQLVLARFGLGIGEAGCTPFAASLISEYFGADLRASALGVYNWGIYTGYSMSYAVGNFITDADINGQGWRWSFFVSAIPGFLVGALILLTVREPDRKSPAVTEEAINKPTRVQNVVLALKNFIRPSVILLCLAGSIRNAGGYVWAYNTEPYYESIDQTKAEIGTYMSWIPLIGGSLGVVLGGFVSDRIVKKRGLSARVIVLVASQLVAAPFCAGALFLNPPWAYISLIPANIFGEMWVGVTMTVMIELVPTTVRTTAVAIYLFIISNIGGNVPLLVPPIKQAFMNSGYSKSDSLRGALYLLYPGLYVISSIIFLLTLMVLNRDARKAQELSGYQLISGEDKEV